MTVEQVFCGPEFIEASFVDVEGRGSPLKDRQFENCSFLKCAFSDADFSGSKFFDCTFQDCDLSNVQWRGSMLRVVRFSGSKLLGVIWSQATAVTHLEFTKCVLDYGNFSGVDLRKSVLSDSSAKEVDFCETNFSESNLQGTDFTGARFANTNLSKADLRRACNYSIRPLENKIAKAKFSLPEATLLLYGLNIILED